MRLFTAFITAFVSFSALAKTPARDLRFQKILHLEKSGSQYKVDFIEDDFFLHGKPFDIEREFEASLKVFRDPHWKHPRLKIPAACIFPARKKRLESITGEKFPQLSCPDLDFWRSRLKTSHVSLVFAGAYVQNPASVFGHSLIRLSNREDIKRSSPLLSHVVGFLANTGQDGSFQRIRKGLLGEYPGHYLIDPFYIKLGVYNNAESRDLWESDLNLTAQEIELLIDHLWELSHFSKRYYFIDRNCSYQILKIIEAVRPEHDLIQRKGLETLPHDSIRWIEEAGLMSSSPRFYPSLRRRMSEKLSRLPFARQKWIIEASQDLSPIKQITNAEELDIINEYWLLRNYQKQTALSENEKLLMETSLIQRSQIDQPSSLQDQFIHRENGPLPAYQAHKTRSIRLGAHSQEFVNLRFFYGAHGFDQDSSGFDDFSSIQYLGFETQQPLYSKDKSENSFTIANIRSFENFNGIDPKKSWLVLVQIQDTSYLDNLRESRLLTDAGWGLSGEFSSFRPYFLLLLNSELSLTGRKTSMLRPGALAGLKWSRNKWRMIFEVMTVEYDRQWNTFENFTLGHSLIQDHSVYLSHSDRNLMNESRWGLNYEFSF